MVGYSVKEIAEKWNLTERQIQNLCRKGLIRGAEKFGRVWVIPRNAEKPNFKKIDKEVLANLPMPRMSPFLDMTNIYYMVGKADECASSLESIPEAKMLFEAEIAYRRGDIDFVYESAQYFLGNHSGFYAMIAGGMLLAYCAIWKGDLAMWREAKMYVCDAPCRNDVDRDILSLALAAIDSTVRNTADFPDWFCRGCFEFLPVDSLPAARYFYMKYLMVLAQELAKGEIELDGVEGLGLMRTIPYFLEPMISQAMAEKTVLVELQFRLLASIAYYDIGDKESAINHIDKAIRIALNDGFLGVLAEHRRQLDFLLDERLGLVDKVALKKLKELHGEYLNGWETLHNAIFEKNIFDSLTIREREVARLAAFGLSDDDIAKRLKIDVSKVEEIIVSVKKKTGATERSGFGAFV